MRRHNQKDGKVRTLTVAGIDFTVKRKFFYCRAWDHFSASNYHCWKGGWVVLATDNETVLMGEPRETSCLGGQAPEFSTQAELKEILADDAEFYSANNARREAHFKPTAQF